MKIAEVRKLKTEDLAKKSGQLRTELAEMRRRHYSGEVTNTRAIRALRKDLARVETVLSEQLAKEGI